MHAASSSILTTKLYIPRQRTRTIQRPQLSQRLNGGLACELTLISAPAGFGKTTLVSEWIADLNIPVAWLSLDPGDKEPTHFLTYVIAALQTTKLATVGEMTLDEVMHLLQSPQPLATESILILLLNELSKVTEDFILVLDDYHLVDSEQIDDILLFLIDNLPPQMHLVMTTREDPPFPLAKYRVKGQLAEIRVADLRFTPQEAAEFLREIMGLSLSVEEIATLERRTEGWIAGLQLAALSMQGSHNTSDFIEAFNGSHHFILDYLMEEVLASQPEQVRQFLLQTSILKSLNGPLCDALTKEDNGTQMLATLASENLFILALDDQRRWYRYHHLFADVLQSRLLEEYSDQVSILNNHASLWFEENNRPYDAIRHALAAENNDRVANLIEQLWPSVHRNSLQTSTLLDLLRQVPADLIKVRPVLSTGYGWMLLNQGDLEAAAFHLTNAENWLEPASRASGKMIIADDAEFQALPGEIASARAYLSLASGDVAGTLKYAQQALDHHPPSDYIRRGPPAAILGLTHWALGELEAAHAALSEGMANFEREGNIVFALSGTYGLADIRIAQGRLHAAIGIYENALNLAIEHSQNGRALQGTADIYLGLAGLNLEQGNHELAAQQLQKSEVLGQPAALPDWPYRLARHKARVAQAAGEFDEALAQLDQAASLYVRTPVPNSRPIAAEKARVWLAQGKLTKAQDWARSHQLAIDTVPSFLQEFESITLAHLQLAEAQSKTATGGLTPLANWLAVLLAEAEAGERMGSVIEILLLQTAVYHAQQLTAEADAALRHALTLGEPETVVQLFISAGPVVHHRLKVMVGQPAADFIAPSYLQKILSAFGREPEQSSVRQTLAEPLSDRELDVLRLLATDLSGPQIADQLLVSLNTMRTHTKNIYSKLGVNNRRTAVRVAEEHHLI